MCPRRSVVDEPLQEPALAWWYGITNAARESWADRVGRTFKAGSYTMPRRDSDIAREAFSVHGGGVLNETPNDAVRNHAGTLPFPSREASQEEQVDHQQSHKNRKD